MLFGVKFSTSSWYDYVLINARTKKEAVQLAKTWAEKKYDSKWGEIKRIYDEKHVIELKEGMFLHDDFCN